MRKTFNSTGYCDPELHYMIDISDRLTKIKTMVDEGKYFTINRARQYGKTTTLYALADFLKDTYTVVSLDFQGLSADDFSTEANFVAAFSGQILDCDVELSDDIYRDFLHYAQKNDHGVTLSQLFRLISRWCKVSEKKIVLLIDEVDSASNNQVFVDFLSQIRYYYLKRRQRRTLQSVILAGVYDVRNIKQKLRPEEESDKSELVPAQAPELMRSIYSLNSPWNIAADFTIDFNFTEKEINGMLMEYEKDYHTGMNTEEVSKLIYEYTSGYPYLVSRLCKLIDESIIGTEEFPDRHAAWSNAGVYAAVKKLLQEKSPLFESLFKNLNQYPAMKERIYQLLFQGITIPYGADDPVTDLLEMFGFVKHVSGTVQIANRIFETRLYNYFLLLPETENSDIYRLAERNKNQFIRGGTLNMDLLLEKFIQYFDDIYGDHDQKFVEDDGRRFFMLFLKPIINGTGNYYVEARTRNNERTDLIIDYLGKQYVIELKVWHGNSYNERGEEQLSNYLDYYHLKKGYMLSFCFNKNKKIGVREIILGDKMLVEGVV